MELESVKRYLEKGGGGDEDKNRSTIEEMPWRFFERFILQGLRVDLIEPGRVICSLNCPPRLLNAGNFMHGGATATLVDLVGSAAIFTVGAPSTGVSVEISVSYLDAAFVGDFARSWFESIDAFLVRAWAVGFYAPFKPGSGGLAEEIEIESKVLRIGKAVAVVSVELRKKDTGKIVAQGRHTKYLAIASKL